MEFPELGQHCANKACQQLDFLPMKCDACSSIFCKDHIQYNNHSCTESYRKDKQVPLCPLCNLPIPIKPGQLADVVVGEHIDSLCQSDPAKQRRKVYTNKCSKKGCKVKEMVRVTCEFCRKNYCLTHRFEKDHDCQGLKSGRRDETTAARSMAAQAALSRNQSSNKASQSSTSRHTSSTASGRRAHAQSIPVGQFQSGLTEDEALQRALQLSAEDAQSTVSSQDHAMSQQEADDLALAQAIAASEREARNNSRPRQNEEKSGNCVIH